jgi:hypothetical protein
MGVIRNCNFSANLIFDRPHGVGLGTGDEKEK